MNAGLRIFLLLGVGWLAAGCAKQTGALVRPADPLIGDDGSGFYKVRGSPVGWGPGVGTIEFAFDPDFPAELRIGCLNAAATWNEAADRALITFAAVDHPASDRGDGVNVISFGGSTRPVPEDHAAETTTRISRAHPPRIFEADIDFESRRFKFGLTGRRGEVDLETACLHELGHALGLTHVDERASIMAPRLTLGTIKREVSDADADRVRVLYPPPVRRGAR